MSDKISLLKNVGSLSVDNELDGFSKVIAYTGESDDDDNPICYTAGTDAGRTLEFTNPFASQTMARNVLARIKGWQYQPYEATEALLDPSAEVGDAISINGMYSGMYVRSTTFDSMMSSDIKAPFDEDIDSEVTYKSAEQRKYERNTLQTKSEIAMNSASISAEVARATEAEGSLSSKISMTASSIDAEVARATEAEGSLSTKIGVTAESISAEISRATVSEEKLSTKISLTDESIEAEIKRASEEEGKLSAQISVTTESIESEIKRATNAEKTLTSSITQTDDRIKAKVSVTDGDGTTSCSWNLTTKGFYVYAHSMNPVLTVGNIGTVANPEYGLSVEGKITATSGFIGSKDNGFTITDSAIYNNMQSFDSTNTSGVYIGTDGIKLGQHFSVDSYGTITASDGTFTGTVKCDSIYVKVNNQYQKLTNSDISSGISGGNNWSSSSGSVWSGVNSWSSSTKSGTSSYPSYFTAGAISAKTSLYVSGSLTCQSLYVTKLGTFKTKNVYVLDAAGNKQALSVVYV